MPVSMTLDCVIHVESVRRNRMEGYKAVVRNL